MVRTFVSHSMEETEAIAESLAAAVAATGLLLLDGDLGAGKTAFVRGLARGLGIDAAEVQSPTFAILNEYGGSGERPRLRHLDLYRIESRAELVETGVLELLGEPGVPMAIEWPRPEVLGEPDGWRVRIDVATSGERRIEVFKNRATKKLDESPTAT